MRAGIVCAVLRGKTIVAHVVSLALALAVAGTSRALSEASRIAAGTTTTSAVTGARHPCSHAPAPTKPGVRHRVEKQCHDAAPTTQARPRVADAIIALVPPPPNPTVGGPLLVPAIQAAPLHPDGLPEVQPAAAEHAAALIVDSTTHR